MLKVLDARALRLFLSAGLLTNTLACVTWLTALALRPEFRQQLCEESNFFTFILLCITAEAVTAAARSKSEILA